MKNILLAILFGLLLTNCSSDDDDTEKECNTSEFYYYSSEKMYLNDLNKNYLIIGFVDEIDVETITNFINNQNSFESITSDAVHNSEGSYRFVFARFKEEKNCSEIYSKIDNLMRQSIVVYANKTYKPDTPGKNDENQFIGTRDGFNVKLKNVTTMSQLENLVSKTEGVSIIKENEFVENQFHLSNISKNRNTIETSNLFYETGLFEFSEPSFMQVGKIFNH